MNFRHGVLFAHNASILAVGVLIGLGTALPARAIELPTIPDVPAVTPGGALPFQGELPRLPRDSGPALTAPEEERPAVPDTGIRMQVKGFILDGVVDRPERGIVRDELERRVEELRRQYPRGLTISELLKVTDGITRTYRSAGYILARAYLPEQKVTDGRVTIRVLEGDLEKLVYQGNESYSDERLSMPFEGLIGEPVNREEMESALLLLGDYPGLTFNSVFSPGDTSGTAKLGLNIEQEQALEGVVWLDNHGSAHTGEYRLWLDASWNNPTGAADRLTGRVLSTVGEEDGSNAYYSLGYQRPVFGPRHMAGFDASKNSYTVGGDFAELDLKGESSMMSAYLRSSFVRSREMNVEGRVALSLKESSSDLSVFTVGEDNLTVLTLGGSGDLRDSTGVTQGALQYSIGLPGVLGAMDEDGTGSSRNGAGGSFGKANLSLVRWQSFPAFPLLRNQTLLARMDVQSTSDMLVSLEQMSLGGPTSVRAYPPSEFMVDSGHFISLEWVARAGTSATKDKLFEGLQVSAFYDYAAGDLNNPVANDIASPEIQGYGVSVQIAPKQTYIARLELAVPTNDPDPSNDRNPQYFFKLGYTF